jgi:hypothetical protein
VSTTIPGGPRVVDVDTLECGSDVVGMGRPPHLAVGENVEPCFFLGPDGEQCGVVLRLLEVLASTRHNSLAGTRGGKRPASLEWL